MTDTLIDDLLDGLDLSGGVPECGEHNCSAVAVARVIFEKSCCKPWFLMCLQHRDFYMQPRNMTWPEWGCDLCGAYLGRILRIEPL